jgi:murein DD-endopeptidase MepM/ murein hydrolase activator NlpD
VATAPERVPFPPPSPQQGLGSLGGDDRVVVERLPDQVPPAAPPAASAAAEPEQAERQAAAPPGPTPLLPAPDAEAPAAEVPVVPPPDVTPPPRAGTRFQWPLVGPVVAEFGSRQDGTRYDGINIAAPRGTPVRAAENGTVAYAGNELRGYGNLILISHAGGWVTAYAHTDRILVSRGDQVSVGQTIATVGSSGSVAESQLHFEIRQGSEAVDPREHLPPMPDQLGAAQR